MTNLYLESARSPAKQLPNEPDLEEAMIPMVYSPLCRHRVRAPMSASVLVVFVLVFVADWVVDPFGSNRAQYWHALGHRSVLPLVPRAPACHGC